MLRVPPRHVRYPHLYTWLVFVAVLDLLFTYLVLYTGGIEANVLAAEVLHRWGFHGMIVFKLSLVVLIVVLCEMIGHRDARWGKILGAIGVGMTCIPVVVGVLILTVRIRHLV